jgi:hypothetical protein
VERGAKSLVGLNDGLDIIEGAFANSGEEIAAGKPAGAALHNLCGVLRQSSALRRKELDKTASRLRVGAEPAHVCSDPNFICSMTRRIGGRQVGTDVGNAECEGAKDEQSGHDND